MRERFEGNLGKVRLVEALEQQKLVRHDKDLAAALAEVADLKPYAVNDEVYAEGDSAKGRLYLIVTGAMDLLVKSKRVDTVHAGELFGEFPFLDSTLDYTVTVRARKQSVVAEITEEDFRAIADRYPHLWKNMAIMLMNRLKQANERNVAEPKRPCVFIGHGRSPVWMQVERYIKDELKLSTVAFESKPRAGMSTLSILDEMLEEATFAIMVLTGDDVAQSGTRARQNVVHEAGLFQGRLGFRRAILLTQSGVEAFSNLHGVQHIAFEEGRIETTFAKLRETLQREGLIA